MPWPWPRRPSNPLDAANLRELAELIANGELKAAGTALRQLQDQGQDGPAVRYVEVLYHFQAGQTGAGELLDHLGPVLAGLDPQGFPEAALLAAQLEGSLGELDAASERLADIHGRRIPPEVARTAAALRTRLEHLRGPGGPEDIKAEAATMAEALGRQGIRLQWQATDLARLDSVLDEQPELARASPERFTALLGEIARRALRARWRLTLREQDRYVVLPGGGRWDVATCLGERLELGRPLYASLHRANRAPFRAIPGLDDAQVYIEPGAHLAVAVDHVARALLGAPVSALAVFRERPTEEGPIILPLSFVDKGGQQRVIYIETRPWEPERVAALRRWMDRLRTSTLRRSVVTLLTAFPPPPAAFELVDDLPAPSTGHLPEDPLTRGARLATPRSIDEPRMSWLDERAEVMERLVRAALGQRDPSEEDLLRKIQETVTTSLEGDPEELSPKQRTALLGYGALYGRILARSLDGRWRSLSEELPPASWEIELPWGPHVCPLGEIADLARRGLRHVNLLARYEQLVRESERAGGSATRDESPSGR